MTNLKYAILESESPSVKGQESKLFLVSEESGRSDDPVTRRVEAALDYELAQGRMPA